MAIKEEPFRVYRFLVEWQGIVSGGFAEVHGLDSTTEIIEYREGNVFDKQSPITSYKLSGMVKYSNITLKRGTTTNTELYNWRNEVVTLGSSKSRKNISILLMDEEGKETIRWNIFDAWPVRIEYGNLNAKENNIQIETLELTHEKFERVVK